MRKSANACTPLWIFAVRYARSSGAIAADASDSNANIRITRFRIFLVRWRFCLLVSRRFAIRFPSVSPLSL